MRVYSVAFPTQDASKYIGFAISSTEELSQEDVQKVILEHSKKVIATFKESFQDKMAALRKLRDRNIRSETRELPFAIQSMAILGAGPAGLIRAIFAILNGIHVKVVEKRAENQEGRLNGIILSSETIAILKECGIYHYLEERQLLGSSPNESRFPHSVAIKDLEAAMKAVIASLLPEQEVIFYETQLDKIIHHAARSVSLVLRVESRAKRTLRDVDLVFVTEGTKSDTASRFLKARRIEVLPPIPVIGGIFKAAQTVGTSFTYTRENSARAIVLFTPGLCSIGCLPLSKNAEALKDIKGSDVERKKKLFKELMDEVFKSEAAVQQEAPTFDDNILVTTSTIFSDFTLPFCGKLGEKSLFLLGGDTLFQIDATSGRGANNAIESSKDFLYAIQDSTNRDQILEKYTAKTLERVSEGMRKVKCMRAVAGLPVNEKAYEFARFQLQHHKLVEKLQAVVGTTLSRLVLSTRLGEKCFRYVAKVLKQ